MGSTSAHDFQARYGPWALVTGASSGIGAEFARQLAGRGLNLLLVARRQARLAALQKALHACSGVWVRTLSIDLSDPDDLSRLVEFTADLDIGLLVNSAGFAVTGEFIEHALQDELDLLNVDCRALMVLSHQFGRRFAQRGRGGLINVASAASFLPLPYWAHYSAAKAYVLQLSEGLWYELRRHGVDVLALCPGATDTEFFRVAGAAMNGGPVEPVVRQALDALGRKVRVVPGWGNRVAAFLPRLVSRRFGIEIGSRVVRPAKAS
jgi:hypothetical protein